MDKKLYKIVTRSVGFGKNKETIIKSFTPKELEDYVDSIGKDLPHPMLEHWVEDVQLLE